MSERPFLLDSNILLRWVEPQNRDFIVVENALTTLANQGSALFYTSQNLGEFWNVCTRPARQNGFGLSPKETAMRARIFESKLQRLAETPAFYDTWRSLLVRYSVSGVQMHDARLVAVMAIHGIRHILTFNTLDFKRYSEIIAFHPEDVK